MGVDLNRNFGFGWGLGGASADPCDPNYEGPEPWSEVEAVAVREYLLSLSPKPVFYQNLHADLQMITYPWGYTCEEDSPEAEDLDAVAVRVKNTRCKQAGFFVTKTIILSKGQRRRVRRRR